MRVIVNWHRMKTIRQTVSLKDTPVGNLRICALSATLPNVEDVATWLEVPPEGMMVYVSSAYSNVMVDQFRR